MKILINEQKFALLISIIEVIYLIILVFFSWANYSNWFPMDLKNLIYIGLSASYGGVLHCIRSMYQHFSNENNFDHKWLPWYIFRPILSFIVGVFSFFMIKGGILLIKSDSSTKESNEIYFFIGLAFIIGIHFTDVMDRLETISKAIFSPKKHKYQENKSKYSNYLKRETLKRVKR